MCGIAGNYRFFSGSADKDLVRKMSEILRHRGPDGGGIFTSGRVSLAHRRLAIIDLSDAGQQPMANENGTLWIVYNGEIYNYIELRSELIHCGHRFSTETDTEVILHAYEEWGAGCLSRFNGMWAFAIWDTRDETLFCARDRFGIKPFYYTHVDDGILFGSEIKALLLHPEVGRTPDDEMVRTFLAWGIHDHSDRTMFAGVYQIPPGHSVTFTPSGTEGPLQYFDLTVNPEVHSSPVTDETAPAALFGLLLDSVRLRLRSDVPVGTCLSGGIDSSIVTALINRLIRTDAPESVGERQKTFSACFADPKSDESPYMKIILDATGAANEQVFPDGDELQNDLATLLYMMDEPFGSLTCYSQYCVMRSASRQVKVVLDGQGADEELAGYIGYVPALGRALWDSGDHIAALSAWYYAITRHLPFFLDARSQMAVRRRRRGCIKGDYPVINRYAGPLSTILKREILKTNLPALLHYEDRNSMAFSIEARVPFLDYRVAEYIASLPLDQKVRKGETKFLLRQAIEGIVPEAIRKRTDKKGFSTPEAIWMKDVLADQMRSLFLSDRFRSRPYWDGERVLEEYQAFLDGKAPYSTDLWRFACVERWLIMFFDNRPPISAI
ncbi:MAG: asparagine synthase (glutamine-hydrolyzing) [Methanocalculus sp.]|uniref:asparagine synthase (glutamine-hydrolyzing) n=1 Tax=Methanocalculus sp. TaxID=2004547 RepID=UPI0027213301|nr:asparagine synthase (glutamine-hydrolyzing) [Methanocalculus sp.]MDO9540309.1 asparagine synthase (glutamine-hydrolyzing) [Methanocalculus sp.]